MLHITVLAIRLRTHNCVRGSIKRVADLGGRDSEGSDAGSDWLVVVTGHDISCVAAEWSSKG
jgi:hypothetical protein